MASSSSDPGSWLIKPSYGMDGGWIGQRGCCCGPVGMCPGRGGVGNLGRNFSFVFAAFVLRPLARKLRRTPRERGERRRGHGFWGRWTTSKLFPKYPEVIINVLRALRQPPTPSLPPPAPRFVYHNDWQSDIWT